MPDQTPASAPDRSGCPSCHSVHPIRSVSSVPCRASTRRRHRSRRPISRPGIACGAPSQGQHTDERRQVHIHAFGKPGSAPTWTSSAKDLFGCALGPARLWFASGFGILNEVCFPRVDIPQVRDLGFIVAVVDTGDSGLAQDVVQLPTSGFAPGRGLITPCSGSNRPRATAMTAGSMWFERVAGGIAAPLHCWPPRRGRCRSAPLPRIGNVQPLLRYPFPFIGAAGGIRTPDPQVRSLMLYPTELRPRGRIDSSAAAMHAAERGYFIVGITNCAPSREAVGQRDVTVLRRV